MKPNYETKLFWIGLPILAAFLNSSVADAAPRSPSSQLSCPRTKAFAEMSKKECEACEAKWVSGEGLTCGAAGTSSAIAGAGFAYVPSLWTGAAYLLSTAALYLACDDECKPTPNSGA